MASCARLRVSLALPAVALLALASPAGGIDLVAKVGDPAPGFTKGTTITSFVEPPSISDGGYAVFHVTVTGDVHAIYRWHRATGLMRVAAGTDMLAFATGMKTLTFLETPIADDSGWVAFTATLDDGKRGLVIWEPPSTLYPVAVVGETVAIACETVGGSNCGPVMAPLGSMATFGDRKGAIFRRTLDTVHEVVFRGYVATAGSPDSLWLGAVDDVDSSQYLYSLASAYEKADGTEATTFYQSFPNVAACGADYFVLDTVGAAPPYAVHVFDDTGASRTLLDRYEAPDLVARSDFHCTSGGTYAYAGGRTDEPLDGDLTTKGVWIGTSQVYSDTVTVATGLTGSMLGAPVGQALTRDDPPKSVFAADIIGSIWDGREGVWRGTSPGDLELLAYELEPLPSSGYIDALWTVHVGGTGALAFHVRDENFDQAILAIRPGGVLEEVLREGEPFDAGPQGMLTPNSFWTLGGAFGADPVVTGTGEDGHVSALNARGEMALLIEFLPSGGRSDGTTSFGLFQEVIDPLIFADGFDDDGYCPWSDVAGAAACG